MLFKDVRERQRGHLKLETDGKISHALRRSLRELEIVGGRDAVRSSGRWL
ncbi:hypothetical protein [Candidatus Alkanophaga liquidiphilum]